MKCLWYFANVVDFFCCIQYILVYKGDTFEKKSNPQTFCQLKPMSILPLMAKIIERKAYLQLYDFLFINKIILSEPSRPIRFL